MLPPIEQLRQRLRDVLDAKAEQGFRTDGLLERLDSSPASYDSMAGMMEQIRRLEFRDDWRYVEPLTLDAIMAECDPGRPIARIASLPAGVLDDRIQGAFLGAVCGCILGKPVEVNPTLEELRRAASAVGEWPLRDYVPESVLEALGRRHADWETATRGRITQVPPDDDLNYTILGALILERHGLTFKRTDVLASWQSSIPVGWSWGAERLINVRAGMQSLPPRLEPDLDEWVDSFNPAVERCGALIRVAAYGYAAAGWPELAARLAFQDASLTHQRTGVYGAMFMAAAIATAFVAPTALDAFKTALCFVPQRSRLAVTLRQAIEIVASSGDWLEAYERLHTAFERFDHCLVHQELGTVVNTLHFAGDVGSGIAMQVSQGNDTDSYGALAGSLLGARFGRSGLESRWLKPFNDRIETTIATFHEHSLESVSHRMSRLPTLVPEGAEAPWAAS